MIQSGVSGLVFFKNCIEIEKSIPYSSLMAFNFIPPILKCPQGLRYLHEL